MDLAQVEPKMLSSKKFDSLTIESINLDLIKSFSYTDILG